MIFDSHAHLIADDDLRYPPSPLLGKLREGDLAERFTAESVLRMMDEAGVDYMCAVQRAHVYGYDNRYVIDAARRYPDRILAVVAIDAAADTAADEIRRWTDQGAVGVRFAALTPQTTDTDWFASAPALRAWAAAEKARVSVCLHVFRPLRAKMLTDLAPLLDRFGNVKVVIDHVANSALEAGAPDHGVDAALLALRHKPNVFFKLTTINLQRIIEAKASPAPMLDHLLAQLGSQRIMWGSDIAQTKGRYADMVAMLEQAASQLSPIDRQRVLSGTCECVYGKPASRR